MVLMSYDFEDKNGRRKGYVFPTGEELASALDVRRQQLGAHKQKLVDRGFISVSRSYNRHNYEIHYDRIEEALNAAANVGSGNPDTRDVESGNPDTRSNVGSGFPDIQCLVFQTAKEDKVKKTNLKEEERAGSGKPDPTPTSFIINQWQETVTFYFSDGSTKEVSLSSGDKEDQMLLEGAGLVKSAAA